MTSPAEQLPKLLRLTASDRDHEALAAIRAINRIVLKHDLDWDQLLANGGAVALSEEQLQRVFAAGCQTACNIDSRSGVGPSGRTAVRRRV